MSMPDRITLPQGEIFDRLDIGKYMRDNSTLDQPEFLTVTNRGVVANATKPAQFTVKFDWSRNPVGQVLPGTPDNELSVWTSIQFIPGRFTEGEISAYLTRLTHFYSNAPLTKLLRGER